MGCKFVSYFVENIIEDEEKIVVKENGERILYFESLKR